jgi:hypothetical protein
VRSLAPKSVVKSDKISTWVFNIQIPGPNNTNGANELTFY